MEGIFVDDLTLEWVLNNTHDHIYIIYTCNFILIFRLMLIFKLEALGIKIELHAIIVENRLLDHCVKNIFNQNLQDRFRPLEFRIGVHTFLRRMILQIVWTIFIQNEQIVIRDCNDSIIIIVKYLPVDLKFFHYIKLKFTRLPWIFNLIEVLFLKIRVSILGVYIFKCL